MAVAGAQGLQGDDALRRHVIGRRVDHGEADERQVGEGHLRTKTNKLCTRRAADLPEQRNN
jgi:hypothetical protein